jgi:hypothetical protein
LMIARRRKTLALCRACRHLLHQGKLPDREASARTREGRMTHAQGVRFLLSRFSPSEIQQSDCLCRCPRYSYRWSEQRNVV